MQYIESKYNALNQNAIESKCSLLNQSYARSRQPSFGK